jgi:hypothetical protein
MYDAAPSPQTRNIKRFRFVIKLTQSERWHNKCT